MLGFSFQAGVKFDESFVRGGVIDFFLQMKGKILRDNRYAPARKLMFSGGIGVSIKDRRDDFKALETKWGKNVVVLNPGALGVAELKPEAIVPK